MRSGIVVAGGRSTRFGERDKALAEVAGDPLVRRVADGVGEVVDDFVVNCRREQVEALERALDGAGVDPRFATDAVPDRGPVAGMATGLRAANGSVAVVTACDMPSLDPDFLGSMLDDVRSHSGIVPIFDDHAQPLCAVYRVAPAIETCDAVLSAGGDGDSTTCWITSNQSSSRRTRYESG